MRKGISRIPEVMKQRQGFHQRGGRATLRAERPERVARSESVTVVGALRSEIDAPFKRNSLHVNATAKDHSERWGRRLYECPWQMDAS